mgnify:CR=1 FL=1
MPKKLLIITYYWPPSGGAGVQRWLKFVKYLRDFGWEPIIFKPEKAEYPELDHTLLKDIPQGIEIVESPIWEPYQLYKTFTGRKKNEKVQAGFINEHKKKSRLENIAVWLRGNIFIPDARRFWIGPGFKHLKKWLAENNVDALVSTGPPHSTHLIALKAKKHFGLPWLADFRDPWTQIDFYDQLMLSKWADRRHQKLEKMVLQSADAVTTVSDHCSSGLQAIAERDIHVITNGFDEADFKELPAFTYDHFSITHIGSMNADRNPVQLWKALADALDNQPVLKQHLRIQLVGKTDYSVFQSLEVHGLKNYVKNFNYLPHQEAIQVAAQSAVILLAINNTPNVLGIAPGKLYEYLALQRPVLCIGPTDGDAARIIEKTNAGITVPFYDTENTRGVIENWFSQYQENALTVQSKNTTDYSRRNLTKKLTTYLDSMVVKEN